MMRHNGVAHFIYKGAEVTFFAPDVVPFVGGEQSPEEEKAADKVRRIRKQLADADMYGAAG